MIILSRFYVVFLLSELTIEYVNVTVLETLGIVKSELQLLIPTSCICFGAIGGIEV